jgi:PAS domain S-box-containing protein
MIWPLWPGCAVLVAVLLLTPRKTWPALLLAGIAGFAIYDVQEALPMRATIYLLVADSIEILVAALGVSYVFGGVPRLNSVKAVGKYALFAVILAPVSVASAAASALEGDSWWVGFFTEALALLTLTPAILSWADIAVARTPKPKKHYFEALLVGFGLATLSYFAFVASAKGRPALLYALVPFLLWAALRLGIWGTSNSIVLVAFLAVLGAVQRRGPFTSDTPVHNVLSLQLFLLVAGCSFMVLAAVADEHKAAEHAVRKSEEALRISEERLRLAQQAARIGTFEWNIQTGVNTWTSELEAIYGLPSGGFGGTQTAFENLLHPEDREEVTRLASESIKTGQPSRGEWRVVWPDGSVHWITGRWQVFMDASGEPLRLVGVNLDITERKRAEEKLREYEKAVEGAEDMIGVVDREYRFLLANRQYLKMQNMTREQVVGHFVPDVLNKQIFETVIKPNLDECFKGKVVKYERKFWYPGVGERDLLLSYFPIEGADGTIDRAACILHDITDRKRGEEALIELNRSLEAQSALLQSREELLKTFVKNVPAAVAMLDRNMRYLQVSDRWCTDYYPGIAQLIGRSHYEIFPDMPDRWKEVHRRCLEGETLRADEDQWDGQDGPHWARWEVRPWMTEEGTVGGILILAEDITRRKRMEEALSTMSRKLIDAQEQERARIGRELHDDINQRLAMLGVELERLQDDPSEIQKRVQELRQQTTEISNDVQALSHELHASKLEYLGFVAGMRSWCREFGERQGMEINFKADVANLIPAEIGLTLFRILQEGLHNAVKHSQVKRIDVHLWEQSNEIHFVIVDAGKGFDVEEAKHGRGLGLASMEERVRLVNGTITFESKLGGGTTIHVHAPFNSEDASRQAAS